MGLHMWHGDAREDCFAIAENFLCPTKGWSNTGTVQFFSPGKSRRCRLSKGGTGVMPKASCCGKQPWKNALNLQMYSEPFRILDLYKEISETLSKDGEGGIRCPVWELNRNFAFGDM